MGSYLSIYLLVHRFCGYRIFAGRGKGALALTLHLLLLGLALAYFLSYGLLEWFMPYFHSIWPVEVVNNCMLS